MIGIGYAAHSDVFDFDYFTSLGYVNISEEDLHCLVAEAVLSGRPGQSPDSKAQVVMGVNYVPADLQVNKAHRRDVRLSHFSARREAGCEELAATAGGKGPRAATGHKRGRGVRNNVRHLYSAAQEYSANP